VGGIGGIARLLRFAYSAERSPRPSRRRRSLRSRFWRSRYSGCAARQARWYAASAMITPPCRRGGVARDGFGGTPAGRRVESQSNGAPSYLDVTGRPRRATGWLGRRAAGSIGRTMPGARRGDRRRRAARSPRAFRRTRRPRPEVELGDRPSRSRQADPGGRSAGSSRAVTGPEAIDPVSRTAWGGSSCGIDLDQHRRRLEALLADLTPACKVAVLPGGRNPTATW
jgi:hypothetical protein